MAKREKEAAKTSARKDPKVFVGQGVKFSPSHHKALQLVGRVVQVRGNFVDVELEADGRIIEVHERIETVPAADVTPAGEGDTNRHLGVL